MERTGGGADGVLKFYGVCRSIVHCTLQASYSSSSRGIVIHNAQHLNQVRSRRARDDGQRSNNNTRLRQRWMGH
jgi:hypothetical protein